MVDQELETALYAHMNNKTIKKKELETFFLFFFGSLLSALSTTPAFVCLFVLFSFSFQGSLLGYKP
jgi:hypothetical protein